MASSALPFPGHRYSRSCVGFDAAPGVSPVVEKDHNRHVLYTEFLIRYLNREAGQLPPEEIADAELVRTWINADPMEHCWEVEKSLNQKALVRHGSPS